MVQKGQVNSESVNNILEQTRFFNRNGQAVEIKVGYVPLTDLKLTVRFNNILEQTNIKSLQGLLNTPQIKLLKVRNCGKKSIRDTQLVIRFFANEHPEIFSGKSVEAKEGVSNFAYIPLFGEVNIDYVNKLNNIKDIFLCQIKLPIRIKNYISEHRGLETIGDITKVSYKELSQNRNIGKSSIRKLREEIENISNYDPRKLGLLLNDPKYILDLIDSFFEEIEDKKLKICLLRWNEKEKAHYQEIGDLFSLTRERIRQIISSIIGNLNKKIFPQRENFYEYFLDKILLHPEPISFETINTFPLLPRKYSNNFYLGILSELFSEVPFEGYLIKNFEQYKSRYSPSDNMLAFCLEQLSKINIPFQVITPTKVLEITKCNSRRDQLYLFSTIFNSKNFWFEADVNGQYYLYEKGNLYEITKNVLEYSDKPLDIDEILNVVRTCYGIEEKYSSRSAVVGNLMSHKDIYQLDRYRFGLEKHLSYSCDEWRDICMEAKNGIRELNRQAYASELFEFVKNKYSKLISKYELVYILRSDEDIIDLGWFNYSLKELGINTRLKVTDAILDLFSQDSNPKHFTTIQKEVQEKRFLRVEAINGILKKISKLEYYGGGFYGLKELSKENLLYLANDIFYLKKIISNDLFPKTTLNKILEILKNPNLEEKIRTTINNNSQFFLYENYEVEPFVILKDWSDLKIVRSILSNFNCKVFVDELKWILNDIGKSFNNINEYKIRNDKHIAWERNQLSYVEFKLTKNDANEIIEISYDFINNSTSKETLEELCDYLNKEYVEISSDELLYILEKDDRFIIIDEQMLMVK